MSQHHQKMTTHRMRMGGPKMSKADSLRTIKVHQYIADPKDNESLDDWIAWYTRIFNPGTPPYSHSEYEGSDGLCFSSTLREPYNGTRWSPASLVLKNSHRWDTYTKEVTAAEEHEMLNRACKINGRPYYAIGLVLDFILPFGWLSGYIGKKLNQWYCSQAVYYVLTGKRIRISPRRLTKYLLKNGWIKQKKEI